MNDLSHDELAHSLALHLMADSRMVWENIVSGPAGSVRPDVFTMDKSFKNPNPISYEIKVSTSDFRSDVTTAKWKAYLDFSYGVVFAAPKGLITRKDIPKGCGFIQYNGTIWHTVKRPTLHPGAIKSEMLLKLLIDGEQQQTQPKPIQNRDFDEWQHHETLRKKFGQDIRQKIALMDKYPTMKANLDRAKAELSELLGVRVDQWDFVGSTKYAINQLKILANEHERKQAIAGELSKLGEDISWRVNRIISEYTKTSPSNNTNQEQKP